MVVVIEREEFEKLFCELSELLFCKPRVFVNNIDFGCNKRKLNYSKEWLKPRSRSVKPSLSFQRLHTYIDGFCFSMSQTCIMDISGGRYNL